MSIQIHFEYEPIPGNGIGSPRTGLCAQMLQMGEGVGDAGDEVVVGCVGVVAVADGTVGVVYCVWGLGEDEGLGD